ncbi:PCNA-associated factor [Aegotheles albertisi]
MVRTKAGGGGGAYRKVLAARAPRKALGSSSSRPAAAPPPPAASPRPGQRRGAGGRCAGNAVCPRPAPAWQRGIGEFLRPPGKENRAPGGEAAGSGGLGACPLPPDPMEDDESSNQEQP